MAGEEVQHLLDAEGADAQLARLGEVILADVAQDLVAGSGEAGGARRRCGGGGDLGGLALEGGGAAGLGDVGGEEEFRVQDVLGDLARGPGIFALAALGFALPGVVRLMERGLELGATLDDGGAQLFRGCHG